MAARLGFAQVPKHVSTKSFVVLKIGISKSNHFGAHDSFEQCFFCQSFTSYNSHHTC